MEKASKQSLATPPMNAAASRSGSPFPTGRYLFRVVLAALAVRLIVVYFVYPSFLAPGRDHWEFGYEVGKLARSIVLGHGFGNPYYGGDTGPTAMVCPIFPYILAGVMAIFGIYTKAAALVILSLNSLFSALTCVPIFFIANRTFGLRVARWAGWTWAFFPYAINFSANSMWDRALTGLVVSLLFLMTLDLANSDRLRAWAGYGLLWGIAALIDAVVLGAFPFLAGWACYRLRQKGRNWFAPAVTAAFVLCLTITPWLVRNHRTFHHPVFLRDAFPQALLVGNLGNTLHWWNGAADPCGSDAEMAEYRRLGELAYETEKWPEAVAMIEGHPGTFVWRSVRRFIYMWTGYWSLRKDYLEEEPFDPYNIFFCSVTTLLMLMGLRRAFQKNINVAMPFALLLLSLPVIYYVTTPFFAYREYWDPEIVVLACYAVSLWLPSSRGSAAEIS